MNINSGSALLQDVQPSWWGKYDDIILRLLDDTGAALPPRVVGFNLEYREIASPHRSTVKRRLQRLEENGYVEKVGDGGYYMISDNGRKYLRDHFDYGPETKA